VLGKIPAELVNVGVKIICYEIRKCTNFIWNKKEVPEEWKESNIVPIYKKGENADCIIILNNVRQHNYFIIQGNYIG